MRLVGGEGVQCQVDAPVAAPLEAWQADDYALVKQTAERTATSAWPGSWKRCRRCSRTVRRCGTGSGGVRAGQGA